MKMSLMKIVFAASVVICIFIGIVVFYPLLAYKPVLPDTYRFAGEVAIIDKEANIIVITRPRDTVSVNDTLYVQYHYKLIEIRVMKHYLNAVCEVTHKGNIEMINEGDAVYAYRPESGLDYDDVPEE